MLCVVFFAVSLTVTLTFPRSSHLLFSLLPSSYPFSNSTIGSFFVQVNSIKQYCLSDEDLIDYCVLLNGGSSQHTSATSENQNSFFIKKLYMQRHKQDYISDSHLFFLHNRRRRRMVCNKYFLTIKSRFFTGCFYTSILGIPTVAEAWTSSSLHCWDDICPA